MPSIGLEMSALPPSAAMVKAVRQIDLAPSGKVPNSFRAALIHETGRVVRIIDPPSLPQFMLSYLTTHVKHNSGAFRDGSIPVMRVPPDFLDVEGDAAAEIYGLVFLGHAEALVVVEGLE